MALLEVEKLTVSLPSAAGWVRPVDQVSFELNRGEVTCIVGESGCGKSTTALALIRLLDDRANISGSMRFDGQEILGLSEAQMCAIRGNRMSMVFQEPMTALNPVKTIGAQVMGPLLLHTGMNSAQAHMEAERLLARVGIDQAARRMSAYPHQLSGGQRQRVVIAMALACKPDLIIADEPTTALDTTVQRQILDLLLSLVDESSIALLLITHNLAIVSEIADKVLVMYGGQVVEAGPAEKVLSCPRHPYTRGLMNALPRPDAPEGLRLIPIAGTVPNLSHMPIGCAFADRCDMAIDACRSGRPPMRVIESGHAVACIRA
ncbi:ABC transporter ATP-binding protein [Paralcaligenes ureilyticus]|uniref:Peptide/nickel transport system ATP-binding protein n=1 Tax=Paralcaligenes ureilyticus TaxID=627131 RepID=A0A4R3M016_9BURK|nr:ABC transporter ATP-binding protein [Paralcaligenes ureilyticus]TCT06381.1 peptide/nickel transport system ATP-binding protein [Paralcaligenes ureilyticus]